MAITITDVVSEYGDYYLNHGQNQANLMQKLHRPSTTANFFRTIPTMDTVLRMGTSEMNRVLQPFQKNFTPIGTLTFKPNPILLFNLKVDKQEWPDDIVNSWLGFLEGEGINRAEWPLVRWMLEAHIIPQAIEDFELNEAFAGVYAAPTPLTAGAAGTAMDGIKQLFADNSSKVNTIASGAVPTDPVDFVDYVDNLFFALIDKEERKRIDYVFMNEDLHLRYRQGKRTAYNINYAQEADLDRLIDFPNAKVAGLPSMGTDDVIWATRAENRVRALKKAEFANFKVGEYAERLVSVFADFWTGFGFPRYESVYKTDQ